MSDPTFTALTAAGARFALADFADPHLDGPTALTITADGRVYGHLAAWGTPHLGMGRNVTPPRSQSGYKFFHQGIVQTADGDLPVGKITLGTGHAPIGSGITADAAAAHYDNTGAVVAAVRAGEDQHGIWLAGRLLPGTAPDRVDQLRLAGVSGDWREVQPRSGQLELVAALAVNVPGFPLPRTEELVAGGTPMALVAAGVVAPMAPISRDDVAELVAAAVQAERATERRRMAAEGKVSAIVASMHARRRDAAVAKVAGVLHGNLAVVAAGKRVRTQEGATRFGVSIGDLVPEAQELAGNFAEAAGNDVAKFLDPKRNAPATAKPKDKAKVGESVPAVKHSGPPAAKADNPKPSDSSAKPDKPKFSGNVSEIPNSSAKPGENVERDAKGNKLDRAPGDPAGSVETSVPARLDGEPGTRMEEDQSPMTGADGGALVDYSNGVATYADGTQTDGTTWTRTEPTSPEGAGPAGDFKPEDGLDPNVDDFDDGLTTSNRQRGEPGEPVADAGVPVRLAGEGRFEEDQAPLTGAHGGQLVEFNAGVAFYDDGTDTDGTTWRWSEPYEDPEEIAASAMRTARTLRALGYTVPNRRAGGARPKG